MTAGKNKKLAIFVI